MLGQLSVMDGPVFCERKWTNVVRQYYSQSHLNKFCVHEVCLFGTLFFGFFGGVKLTFIRDVYMYLDSVSRL